MFTIYSLNMMYIIIAIIIVISEIWPQYFLEKVEEKRLKDQYYGLGRSVQDIADEQRVSMIIMRLDKLENTSN